jgi:hypothetical protein
MRWDSTREREGQRAAKVFVPISTQAEDKHHLDRRLALRERGGEIPGKRSEREKKAGRKSPPPLF